MNKKRLIISVLAIISLVCVTIGGYVHKDAIQSCIARTAAVVSGQEIKPLLDSERFTLIRKAFTFDKL